MDSRYNSIREGHENADATRTSARSEVAQYDAAVVAAKAEAAKVVDAARATLEAERQAAITAANEASPSWVGTHASQESAVHFAVAVCGSRVA